MKRSLIAVALGGLFVNAAFATPTLNGDDSYDAVHMISPKSTSQTEQSNSQAWGLIQLDSRAVKAYGLINDPAHAYFAP